jgi:MFS family permease
VGGAFSELRGRVLWVVVGCALVQLGVGYGYVGGPLAPFLEDEFGWSRAEIAATRGFQPFLLALASPLVGFLAVRFGARFVLASGAVVLGVTFMLGATVQTWAQLSGMWAIQGLSVALLGDIAVGSVVVQWTQRSRALALGIAYTGANIGGAIAARSLVAVADASSWRMGMFVLGAAALVVILPAALFMIRERTQGSEVGADTELPDRGAPLPLRAIVATRSFWVLIFSHVSYWLFMVLVLDQLVFMLEDLGLTRSEATAHAANLTLLGAVSKVGFGGLVQVLRMSARTGMLLDFGLLAAAAALLFSLQTGWVVPAFVVLFGFGYAARDVVTPLAIAHCFGAGAVAQVYGLVMLTFLVSPLGPILGGLSFDRTGSYTPAIIGLGTLVLLSFFSIFLLRDERAAG